MPELVEPTIELYAAWRDAIEEWGPGMHEDGFGLLASDAVDSAEGIERHGGTIDEADAPRSSPVRRYWISLVPD
ncbi:hypothetical protein H9639_13700 [Arthrobacter sp. Sa2CUA1]|uniref:Uncharacterized protein n=1 Tax=Arthrobacter gallicola TaxID=2762225 RepID=A0ABR8UUX5_9MICC|nr:hypothetical protein [Arthrobacter gallicola]MBD7996354.1 hypothetical protein [Arthrobacter gallicola]